MLVKARLGEEPSQDFETLAWQGAKAIWLMEREAEHTAWAIGKVISKMFGKR